MVKSSKYTGTQEASRVGVHARARGTGARPNVADLLARGSAAFRRLNAGGDLPRPAAANLEPHSVHVAPGAPGRKAAGPRVRLTVRSYRARLCDPDGISVKAAIDGLVQAGVIPDDNAEVVKGLTIEQVKVRRGEERTVIEVQQLGERV